MKLEEYSQLRKGYQFSFEQLGIRLGMSGHAEERATVGDRGDMIDKELLQDFLFKFYNAVKGKNRQLTHAVNTAKTQMVSRTLLLQVDVGAKKRQLNVPIEFNLHNDGKVYAKFITILLAEEYRGSVFNINHDVVVLK